MYMYMSSLTKLPVSFINVFVEFWRLIAIFSSQNLKGMVMISLRDVDTETEFK